jgi:hypothetical protein
MIPLVQFHIKAPLDGTRIGSSLDRTDGLFTATFALESEDLLHTGKQKAYGENHFVGKGQVQPAD